MTFYGFTNKQLVLLYHRVLRRGISHRTRGNVGACEVEFSYVLSGATLYSHFFCLKGLVSCSGSE